MLYVDSEVKGLADLSSLTNVQVETVRIRRSVLRGEISIQTALKMRKNSSISRGTYYRILAQARKNIRESLFTVATAVQLGLIRPEDVQKLVATISLLPDDVNPEKSREVVRLARALADRIVML